MDNGPVSTILKRWNYVVAWGDRVQYEQGCDTWDEVKGIIAAVKKIAPKNDSQHLTVRGKDYDVGGPDEPVRTGLTEDQEIELEYIL